MECPYCKTELINCDSYGKTIYGEHYWIQSYWEKLGNIFKCPNSEGFQYESEAKDYANENNINIENWEELSCESGCYNGFFYEDRNGNLRQGYPC